MAIRGLPVIGLDIGGANTKAALVDDDNRVSLSSEPFEVWRAPRRLGAAIARVVDALDAPRTTPIALATTAELVDVYPDKRAGVRAVLGAAATALRGRRIAVLRTNGELIRIADAASDPLPSAAANWAAVALVVAREVPDVILVDCGGTTTDVIPIAGGRVNAAGRTDLERLRAGELVYTGALRTNLAAVLDSVEVDGVACPVASEQFALSADAHLLLGHLAPAQCTCRFPDDRGPGRDDVRRRLARLVCADPDELPPGALEAIAFAAHEAQVTAIAAALQRVRERAGAGAPVLALGVGAFLAHEAAERLGIHRWTLGDPAYGSPLRVAAPGLALLLGDGAVVAPAVALSVLGRE